jgi:hypothetical protein
MAADRREFLAALSLMSGVPGVVSATSVTSAQSAPKRATPEWDLSWLDQLKGKHKQVFDIGQWDLSLDTPLRVPMNYLDAFRDVFQITPPDVNIVLGIQRVAFPMNVSDAIWRDYKIGERWNIKDPQTGQPATRNIFLGQTSGGPGSTVRALQARGAVFWQCNVALSAVVTRLAGETGKAQQDIRAELVAGLNPGVKLVPAHTLLVGLAQERGFTYEKV